MPGKFIVLNILTIILQYSLLVLLYYFLIKVIQMIYRDLKNHSQQPINSRMYFTQPSTNPAKLILLSTSINLTQNVFNLREITSIGRNKSNDIIIDELFVSSEHACIERYKQDYWLSDLGSTNGTFVNDDRITQKVLLQNNDLIKIGAAAFRFER